MSELLSLLACPIFALIVFLLGYTSIVFILKKHHDSETDNPNQQNKLISVSLKILRQFPGYAAALLLPANLIITFLVFAYLTTVPGSDQGDGFYMPFGELHIAPPLVFAGIFLLGIPLSILGGIMILFGQRNRLYVVAVSIGLVVHLLLPFAGAILFLIMFYQLS